MAIQILHYIWVGWGDIQILHYIWAGLGDIQTFIAHDYGRGDIPMLNNMSRVWVIYWYYITVKNKSFGLESQHLLMSLGQPWSQHAPICWVLLSHIISVPRLEDFRALKPYSQKKCEELLIIGWWWPFLPTSSPHTLGPKKFWPLKCSHTSLLSLYSAGTNDWWQIRHIPDTLEETFPRQPPDTLRTPFKHPPRHPLDTYKTPTKLQA